LHVECLVVSGLSSTRAYLILQRSIPSTKSTFLVSLSDRHWTIYQLFQVLGLDKIPKNAPHYLLLALISLPLNDPRRQGIGIFSSSQLGCLQDNTLCTFILYTIDLIMEHIYMRYSIRKVENLWIKINCQMYVKCKMYTCFVNKLN